jgi:hypothetical protein
MTSFGLAGDLGRVMNRATAAVSEGDAAMIPVVIENGARKKPAFYHIAPRAATRSALLDRPAAAR